jgi:hypothetical protein
VIGRLSGRVAVLLSASAVLVVVLVGWLVLVSPQRSKAADLTGQVDETQAQLLSTQAYVKSPVGRQAVSELKRLRLAVPDEARVSEIIRQLVQAQDQSGIQIDAITPQSLVPASGAQALPISLTVEGHYFNIAKFLDLLGTRTKLLGNNVRVNGRLYAVDSIQFGSGGGGTAAAGGAAAASTGMLSATISLNAFVFGGAPVAPSSSTDTTTTTNTTTTSGP